MATNEKQDKNINEAALTPKSGQGGTLKWIIVGLLVLLIVGASVVGSAYFLTKATGGEKEKPAAGIPWPSDPLSFIVNLADEGGNRYLKATMVFEVQNPAALHELDMAESRIRDTILDLLSSKSQADLADSSGKQRLREEIITRVNGTTPTGRISRVNLREFVIQ